MAHWLDSDVPINAKNDAYGFDFAPGFWDFLHEGFVDGRFCLADAVVQEIYRIDDELAGWVRDLPAESIIIQDQAVQTEYQPIADHVQNGNYPNSRKFLAGADGWLVAPVAPDIVLIGFP